MCTHTCLLLSPDSSSPVQKFKYDTQSLLILPLEKKRVCDRCRVLKSSVTSAGLFWVTPKHAPSLHRPIRTQENNQRKQSRIRAAQGTSSKRNIEVCSIQEPPVEKLIYYGKQELKTSTLNDKVFRGILLSSKIDLSENTKYRRWCQDQAVHTSVGKHFFFINSLKTLFSSEWSEDERTWCDPNQQYTYVFLISALMGESI